LDALAANISVKRRSLKNLATHSFHSHKSSPQSVDEFPPFDTLNRGAFQLKPGPAGKSGIPENLALYMTCRNYENLKPQCFE
jgi:hypothetical protein